MKKIMLIVISVIFLVSLSQVAFAEDPKPQYGGVLNLVNSRSIGIIGYPPQVRGYSVKYNYCCLEQLCTTDTEGRFSPTKLSTAYEIGADGKVVGKYRKTHIPLVKNPDGDSVYEKFYFRPGNLGFPVFDTPFGLKFGIIICYDRHFSETGRLIALGGADLLFVPSASAGLTCNRWEVELQFHAMSNVMFVGGVNRVGKDKGISTGRKHFGSSMVVDFRGEVIARAGNETDEIVYADLDPNLVGEFRNYCGYYRDRRPGLYTGIGSA